MEDESKLSRAIVLAIGAQGVVEAHPINCKPPEIQIDMASHFVTNRTEKDRDAMIRWARNVANR
ncbi:hypothetical protein A2U01_0023658 [Trifolium medium]|uniref:Uncharacterized protein n=1 Tax=Trifolium medium TaxID=97028 RepID=A0A392NVW1_9FABA|nr:hypothetical protein [Trifolium medium]